MLARKIGKSFNGGNSRHMKRSTVLSFKRGQDWKHVGKLKAAGEPEESTAAQRTLPLAPNSLWQLKELLIVAFQSIIQLNSHTWIHETLQEVIKSKIHIFKIARWFNADFFIIKLVITPRQLLTYQQACSIFCSNYTITKHILKEAALQFLQK